MTAKNEDQVCVFLWALPRSVSTAMTKCMSFVEGVQIWHEPYLTSHQNEKFRDLVVIEKMSNMGMNFEEMGKIMKPVLENVSVGKRIQHDLFRLVIPRS